MNKEDLLQKIKDEVAQGFTDQYKQDGYLGWHEVIYAVETDSMPTEWLDQMIGKVAIRYAIAMCEEQKKHDSEIALDEKHFFVGDIMNAILETKNVAE